MKQQRQVWCVGKKITLNYFFRDAITEEVTSEQQLKKKKKREICKYL